MLIHQLTTDECLALLASSHIARLACSRADQPYIVPISFHFSPEDRCLYGFSTAGQKIEWMRANPLVCVEVDEIGDRLEWSSVVVVGRYQEISRDNVAAVERARHMMQATPSWWLPGAAKLTDGTEHDVPVFYRIVMTSITGRRAQGASRSATQG
jgi:uncharacterized protein